MTSFLIDLLSNVDFNYQPTSVANSITAVQILKTKAVIVRVFDHFPPKYAVIIQVLSD
jgi:hypothetical protein